jgi:hypothetical protein
MKYYIITVSRKNINNEIIKKYNIIDNEINLRSLKQLRELCIDLKEGIIINIGKDTNFLTVYDDYLE